MADTRKVDAVRAQYATADNLQGRRLLYARYETNPEPLADWMFRHLAVREGDALLELGCGPGDFLLERRARLPQNATLTLTDFSAGMVEAAAKRAAGLEGVTCLQADIQQLPFADASFDIAIANHMLYHVPDILRALAEVARVLRPGGTLYASTNSSDGMPAFLHRTLAALPGMPGYALPGLAFSVENGQAQLKAVFARVHTSIYANALVITSVDDLMAYTRTMMTTQAMTEGQLAALLSRFEQMRREGGGAIRVSIRAGQFVAVKGE